MAWLKGGVLSILVFGSLIFLYLNLSSSASSMNGSGIPSRKATGTITVKSPKEGDTYNCGFNLVKLQWTMPSDVAGADVRLISPDDDQRITIAHATPDAVSNGALASYSYTIQGTRLDMLLSRPYHPLNQSKFTFEIRGLQRDGSYIPNMVGESGSFSLTCKGSVLLH